MGEHWHEEEHVTRRSKSFSVVEDFYGIWEGTNTHTRTCPGCWLGLWMWTMPSQIAQTDQTNIKLLGHCEGLPSRLACGPKWWGQWPLWCIRTSTMMTTTMTYVNVLNRTWKHKQTSKNSGENHEPTNDLTGLQAWFACHLVSLEAPSSSSTLPHHFGEWHRSTRANCKGSILMVVLARWLTWKCSGKKAWNRWLTQRSLRGKAQFPWNFSPCQDDLRFLLLLFSTTPSRPRLCCDYYYHLSKLSSFKLLRRTKNKQTKTI